MEIWVLFTTNVATVSYLPDKSAGDDETGCKVPTTMFLKCVSLSSCSEIKNISLFSIIRKTTIFNQSSLFFVMERLTINHTRTGTHIIIHTMKPSSIKQTLKKTIMSHPKPMSQTNAKWDSQKRNIHSELELLMWYHLF